LTPSLPRALIAAINAVKPGIAPSVMTLDPTKWRHNCTTAIKIADIHLKIPKIVSADDLSSGNIDELSMMTYLSYFVEHARAKLLKWVRKTIPRMGITDFTSNWFDGKAYSALINACFPGTLPEWMKITNENSLEKIAEMYIVCEKRLSITPNFSSEDLISGKVEELEIMTFVMQIQASELKSLPEEVVVSGHGLEHARIGKEAIFFINTKEAGPGKLLIDSYYENGKKVKFKLEEKVHGVLTLSYTPRALGTIVFDIRWSDVPVAKNPFKVRVTDSSLIQILDYEHHSKLRVTGLPIELRLNTKETGRVNLSAHLTYDDKEKVKAEPSMLDDHVTRLTYTPPKAGKPVLHIFMNDTELIHLSIPYIVVEVGGYKVSKLPESRVYQTFEEASFSIDSSNNLPLDVLQMTAVLTTDIQIAVKFKSIVGNTGTASFKPTLPGVYNVEVVCVDTLIQGCPFTVEVSDPLSCRLNGTAPQFMELEKPYTFELDTKDAGVGDVTFECVDIDTVGYFTSTFREESEEYFKQLEICPHAEGEYLVGIKYHKDWISGSPFRVRVCDPSKFTVVGDLVEKKMDVVGKPCRFKITSLDEIDDNFKPVVKASGPSAKYSPKVRVNDDDPCTLNVSFTPHEIGTHEVVVTYGGFHIPSSPFLVAVIDFDSNTCSATGSGLQEAFTNIPAQFVVLTRTAGLVEDGTLQVSITGVLNKVECQVRVRDNKNGLYNVAYIVTNPGAYLITIVARDKHIAGSPFKLHVQPGPEPEKCRMYGPALEDGAVLSIGKPIDFSVDTSKGGTGKLTVKAIGPGGVTARVFTAKSRTKGTYEIKLDPIRYGKYRVNVKWSDQHIPQSPFILKIFPGVDATKCKAYGPGLEDGLVGNPTSFTIETRDAGPGTLRVCLHKVKDAFKIDLKPKDPKDARTLVARYYPRKPGDYLISILWSEKHIPGSPFKVRIRGEAMEDDFRPNKFKSTPLIEELHVIEEVEEEDDDNETVDLDTDFDVASVISKPRELHVIRTSASLDEMKMPHFSSQSSQKGYHDTFVHSSKLPALKSSVSMPKLESKQMMTFSNMQQARKKRPAKPASSKARKGQSAQS
jgi:filamin